MHNITALEVVTVDEIVKAGKVVVKNKKLELFEITHHALANGVSAFCARNKQNDSYYCSVLFDQVYKFSENNF